MKGTIVKRGDAWRLFVSAGIQSNGERYKRVTRTVRGSKAEAQRRLRELIAEVEEGTHRDDAMMHLDRFLTTRWLPLISETVRQTTAQGYETIVRRRIVPNIGHISIGKLTPEDIQGLYASLIKGDAKSGSAPLSRRSVLHTHRVLSRALGNAVKLNLLTRNPCAAVEPPKPENPEIITLEPADIDRILGSLEGSWARMPVFLAAYTGMRRSEILGLQWHDIDWDRSALSVRRSLHQLTNGDVVVTRPKSARGQRMIALTRHTMEALRDHLEATKARYQPFDRVLALDDHLFMTMELRPEHQDYGMFRSFRPHSLSQAFRKTVRQLGMNGVTIHGLRHTHASLMLRANIHPKIVSERLGHANIAITLDLYSHVSPGLQEAAALKFEDVMTDSRSSSDGKSLLG